jgi:hypothetical protein
MADTSALLNDVAADMARLAPAIAALVDENTRLAGELSTARGEADTLRAEDTAETSAAENVRTEWNNIASRFTSSPDVPDVPPLPDNGGGTPEPANPDEPAPQG